MYRLNSVHFLISVVLFLVKDTRSNESVSNLKKKIKPKGPGTHLIDSVLKLL